MTSPVYLDFNATTPVSTASLEAWVRVSREVFGNASSIHQQGQAARRELESARSGVARLLGAASPKEVVFCSGGTEADNAAILGVMRHAGPGAHLVTTQIEHPAVLQTAAQLEREGFRVTYVRVGANGVVDADDIRRAALAHPKTALISVMHVNNEIGTVQPLEEIAAVGTALGVPVHSDGVQAAGRIPVNLEMLGVDLYSVSGHKMHAPKGVGVLYVRQGLSSCAPILFGGRHELGRRPGTENVASAAALAAAADEVEYLRPNLRDRLESMVQDRIPDVRVVAKESPRAPNTSCLCVEGIEGEAMVIALDLRGFCVSSGSACSSGAVEPSHVLTAIGLSNRDAKSCIRISLGRQTTPEEVDAFVEALEAVTTRLRRLSTDYVAHA